MIRHLMKLVWNRKRVNSLIITEVFLSFLVVFAVVTLGVHFGSNAIRDLGFDIERVWGIDVRPSEPHTEENAEQQVATMARLLQEARSLDEVEAAALASDHPYDGNTNVSSHEIDGRRVRAEVSSVSDEFAEVMGIEVASGRWFSAEDDAFDRDPIVIDRELARDLFGNEDPLGKLTLLGWGRDEKRVVGVIADYRKGGEFSVPGNYLIQRRPPEASGRPNRRLMLKVRPGTTAIFEESLVKRLTAIAPGWSFEIAPLEARREQYTRETLAPLIAVGVVAAFLMLMVGLGLIGVLWQNVTQRTREIGLRRAAGATQARVHRQILTELMLITTMGLLLGTITVAHVPLLDIIGQVRPTEFALGLVLSLASIYLLTAACGLYPSWLATRVQPAEALHYE